jgi:hypothetical protein
MAIMADSRAIRKRDESSECDFVYLFPIFKSTKSALCPCLRQRLAHTPHGTRFNPSHILAIEMSRDRTREPIYSKANGYLQNRAMKPSLFPRCVLPCLLSLCHTGLCLRPWALFLHPSCLAARKTPRLAAPRTSNSSIPDRRNPSLQFHYSLHHSLMLRRAQQHDPKSAISTKRAAVQMTR